MHATAPHPSSTSRSGAFYHVTTASALDSIRLHGLDNTRSMDELWGNTDDWDDGVYMWDDHAMAEAYAADLRDMGHAPVVLTIDGSGLTVEPDLTGDTRVEGAWYTPVVPVDRIRFPH